MESEEKNAIITNKNAKKYGLKLNAFVVKGNNIPWNKNAKKNKI